MKKYVIYKIINPIGQIYIGQTCDIERRINTYRRLQCKGQYLLYASLKRYGFGSRNPIKNLKKKFRKNCAVIIECDKDNNYKQTWYSLTELSNILNIPRSTLQHRLEVNCHKDDTSVYFYYNKFNQTESIR